MRVFIAFCLHAICVLGSGCGSNSQTEPVGNGPSLPVVSGSALKDFLQSAELPVLVEFGVDFNCPRCQQAKPEVLELQARLQDRVRVVRVDFNSNMSKVTSLGGTICPTYVLFDQGEAVITRSFPVTMDLLESEILQRLTH